MSINAGLVSIEDGIPAKTGDYDPKRKVRVEFSFSVEAGQEAVAQAEEAGDAAQAQVARLLGTTVAPKATRAKAADKPKTEPEKPAEKTKADLAREAGLPTETVVEKVKPAEDDELFSDGDPDAPKPITDAELTAAAQAKNKVMKDKKVANWAPAKIHTLREKFTGPDKFFRDIPTDKRSQFLKELEELN